MAPELRIQGKNTLKWNSSACKKYEYGHFGSPHIKLTLYKRFLKKNKIFKKYEIFNSKTLFSVIGPFCTPYPSCGIIGFWQSKFVWKCFQSFSTKKRYFLFFWKFASKLKYWKIYSDCHIKACRSLKRRAILKVPSTVFNKSLCSFCGFQN